MCIADNFICMDKERIEGFRKAFEPGKTLRWEIAKTEKERMRFYEDNYMQLLKSNVKKDAAKCEILQHPFLF